MPRESQTNQSQRIQRPFAFGQKCYKKVSKVEIYQEKTAEAVKLINFQRILYVCPKLLRTLCYCQRQRPKELPQLSLWPSIWMPHGKRITRMNFCFPFKKSQIDFIQLNVTNPFSYVTFLKYQGDFLSAEFFNPHLWAMHRCYL